MRPTTVNPRVHRRPSARLANLALPCLTVLLLGLPGAASGQDHAAVPAPGAASPARKPSSAASAAKEIGDQLRDAVDSDAGIRKRTTLVVNGKEKKYITLPEMAAEPRFRALTAPGAKAAPTTPVGAAAAIVHVAPGAIANPVASRQHIRARATALARPGSPETFNAAGAGAVRWSYAGSAGPQAWGGLKPDFNLCATGRRQAPINIEPSTTLQGPAEPIQFNLSPSSASVVNNGHTIQVDVVGDNSITVRGSNFKLQQLDFHHPSEERVNDQGFAMAAHLLHRNAEGELAIVAVLLEVGAANSLVNKVWTYMPLDAGDRVRMPAGSVEIAELLPRDQRYYQFMGSLTTPPCSEGVLWLVLKQPVTLSPQQLRLFSQLFANNARPVQPVNGRPVREAQ